MRTTLTLEPDVAQFLKEQAKLEDKSFKQVVNEMIRRGMKQQEPAGRDRKPFKIKPHRSAFRPGVDLLKLNQAADDLEADAFLERLSGGQGA